MFDRVKDNFTKKKFIKQLHNKSDRELEDMSIPRKDIKKIVNKLWGKDK